MVFIRVIDIMTCDPIYSIVIPLYNEGSNLRILLSQIRQVIESFREQYEIILIDDGSSDNTWYVICEESKNYPMLCAIRLSRNFGKESALCAGLELAKGKAVIVMDGDMQHPPQLIPELIRPWLESHAKVVEAVKSNRGKENFFNKLGSKLFYTLLKKSSGYDLTGASDYKLLDRQVVDEWIRMRERNLFFRGMSRWLGFKRVEIPFEVPERMAGKTKWSVYRLTKLAITGVTAFSSIPLHFITVFGVGFLAIALILSGQTLYLKIVGKAVTGFTTVVLLLLIIGSMLMIGLGIIGEYIARIYEEIKGRPRYVVAEVLNEKNKFHDTFDQFKGMIK